MRANRHTDADYSRNLLEAQPMPDKASLLQQPAPLADAGLRLEIATLFVHALNLEVTPEEIDPDAPLYGAGLGLDSIDILEVALLVSKQYGIQLRADSQENQQIFRSLRHLAEYIAAQRTK
jgi:acyl carrier protein